MHSPWSVLDGPVVQTMKSQDAAHMLDEVRCHDVSEAFQTRLPVYTSVLSWVALLLRDNVVAELSSGGQEEVSSRQVVHTRRDSKPAEDQTFTGFAGKLPCLYSACNIASGHLPKCALIVGWSGFAGQLFTLSVESVWELCSKGPVDLLCGSLRAGSLNTHPCY